MKIALLAIVLLWGVPVHAQSIDPDWCLACKDSREHFAAGAGIQVATLLVLPRTRAWQRLAVTTTIAAAYELGQLDTPQAGPGFGFGPKDLLLSIVGALAVEALRKKL